jgi:hypothetical protein
LFGRFTADASQKHDVKVRDGPGLGSGVKGKSAAHVASKLIALFPEPRHEIFVTAVLIVVIGRIIGDGGEERLRLMKSGCLLEVYRRVLLRLRPQAQSAVGAQVGGERSLLVRIWQEFKKGCGA